MCGKEHATQATALATKIETEFYRAGVKGLIPPFVFSTAEVHIILRALRNEPGGGDAMADMDHEKTGMGL